MTGRTRGILLLVVLVAAGLVAGGLLFFRPTVQNTQGVTVFTDKAEYGAEETVRITIHNAANHPVDIYCTVFCALGNFPTRVERVTDGAREEFAGFCPSIEPLFGSGEYEDDDYRHRPAAGDSFELEISGFPAMGLCADETLRIVYYLGAAKTPVYSNEFTIRT